MTHSETWLRKVDLLVAEIDSWEHFRDKPETIGGIYYDDEWRRHGPYGWIFRRDCPLYHDDWNLAMGAAEAYGKENGLDIEVTLLRGGKTWVNIYETVGLTLSSTYEDSGPLAICLAIIKAAGKEVPEK